MTQNTSPNAEAEQEKTIFQPGEKVRLKTDYLMVCFSINGKQAIPVMSELANGDSTMTVIATTFETPIARAMAMIKAVADNPAIARMFIEGDALLEVSNTYELVEVHIETPAGVRSAEFYAHHLERDG